MRVCVLLLFFCVVSLPQYAIGQNAADEYYSAEAMENSREILRRNVGEQKFLSLFVDHFEYTERDGNNSIVGDAQLWFGNDEHKFGVKLEGEYDLEESVTEELEVQALYHRPINPFWNLQIGLRHDFKPEPVRDYFVLGLEGEAPYGIEMDAAFFLNDKSDFSFRLKSEYDLRFTQRLILQPKIEVNYAISDDTIRGIGEGFYNVNFALRLRYEIKREFAPFIGVSWDKAYGETDDLLQAAGKDDGFSVVMGIKFWY